MKELMQAVYYDRFGATPVVKQVPIPEIGGDSVLVEVKATGICRSDWHGWKGHDRDIKLPHVPGHEFAGIIAKVGSNVSGWSVGDRVTTPFVQACGDCIYCRQQDQQVCLNQEQAGFTHWGSFAEYVEVRNAMTNLVLLPEKLTFEMAALMGCRFGTSYRAVCDQAKLKPGDFLVVFGAGGVGLSAIMIAMALGARVAVIDPQESAQALAMSCGAEIAFNEISETTADYLKEWSEFGAHACLDAIGHPGILHLALTLLRRRGKFVQVGLLPDEQGLPSCSFERVVAHELEIMGSHGIQAWQYHKMLAFVDRHELPLHKMLKATYTLRDAAKLLMQAGDNSTSGVSVVTLERV
jgi:alcohol dehydrogenase